MLLTDMLMTEKTIIKCFIASPGDTKEEREICESVFSTINQGIGEAYNFKLESLKWENNVHPGIGEDGQAVINNQVKDKYDLFIGIMYTKFGSPTLRAESGTEEEFNIAYKKAIESKNMEIFFYFNDMAINPSKIDLSQYRKVKDFRDNVVAKQCMYCVYNGVDDFKEKLAKNLNQYFNDRFSAIGKNKAEELTRTTFVLEERLNHSLKLFSGQPKIWIEPIISKSNEISFNPDTSFEDRVDINEIVKSPCSIIISAPPQFGLTCLANYMVLEAWKQSKLWIYVDAKKLKAHNVKNYIKGEYESLNLSGNKSIDCIILDEWNPNENGSLKKLKSLCDEYSNIPIILMRTLPESKFIRDKQEDVNINRSFKTYFLLAMTRHQIRNIVREYNHDAQIADENDLLEKLIKDLETLNIHRTPQNCLTLLKVDEKKFDDNPVNRCQMLEDVLYVLFEFTDLPRYNSTPDVKDCQYLLGCFCEYLFRQGKSSFCKDEFMKVTSQYSKSNLIEIDINSVFETLYINHIISEYDQIFSFKSGFWLLYFVAIRMNSNQDFRDFIFTSKKYLDYPEIIEFYTGIDRNKTDALKILMDDIKVTCDTVFTRIGIPDNINPYKHAIWHPSNELIDQIQKEIGDSVISSGLPEAIKDKYLDKQYNQLEPYNQDVVIHDFFEEYYVYNLMQEIKSSSRALRNSDYADAETKKQLMSQILRGWLQISKVLFALIPVLASKGRAAYGGAGFLLSDDFGNTIEERARKILFVILTNVVGFFKDDLYSSKISPLLHDSFDHPNNPLIKQQLALLFVICRPNKWYSKIEEYIVSLPTDSFFLYEIVNEMRAQYKFGFIEENDLRLLSCLIKKSLAKHEFSIKNPSPGQVKKISTSAIPRRDDRDY
jgi:hypothetical protein